MSYNGTVPSWANGLVSNWRRKAKIPDTIPDNKIYDVVKRYDLYYDNSMEDSEVLEQLNILRSALELEELTEF